MLNAENNESMGPGLSDLADGQDYPEGALYVVAVPIGNMADITVRALKVLGLVDVVAAEDTRCTMRLLNRYGIRKNLVSVREHNEAAQSDMIIQRLRKGQRIALVTDAGTPGISDPGARTVSAVSRAGLRVVPVPGPSALVCAVSAAGLAEGGFTFAGFLPAQQAAMTKALEKLARTGEAFVLYEAPHRIARVFAAMAGALDAQRQVTVCRELTKRFEEIRNVTAGELPGMFAEGEPLGEFVVVVHPAGRKAGRVDERDALWIEALREELPPARLAGVVSKVTGCRRKELYALIGGRDEA